MPNTKMTVPEFINKKKRSEKIAIVTAYDFPSATIADSAGVDAILVGDSVGMVALGYKNTIPVNMDIMLHHVSAVSKGAKNALVIADMPFLSYQTAISDAVRNAGRFLQEAGAAAVKLEGGIEYADTVAAISKAGIPIMGHIGLLPQSINRIGGYRPQGREESSADKLIADAESLQDAGAFAIVLELVPMSLSEKITNTLSIPTIGIGSGPACDGQVLVWHDLLGIYEGFAPKHAKRYAEIGKLIHEAIKSYVEDVRSGAFPTEKESVK